MMCLRSQAYWKMKDQFKNLQWLHQRKGIEPELPKEGRLKETVAIEAWGSLWPEKEWETRFLSSEALEYLFGALDETTDDEASKCNSSNSRY